MARHARPKAAVTIALLACLWATPVQGQSLEPRSFLASAYCCQGVGGGYCGTTASGTRVGPNQIAADWRVLPRGSVWQVDGYGVSTVTDTGGDIKGQRIDVWFYDCAAAWNWGKRWVFVRPVPEFRVLLWEHEYWDTDAMVRERTWDTPRGVVKTWEVLP